MVEQWGFKTEIKYVLVESAPFTASGLNEIIAAAKHRSMLLALARSMGIKVSGRSQYRIIKREL